MAKDVNIFNLSPIQSKSTEDSKNCHDKPLLLNPIKPTVLVFNPDPCTGLLLKCDLNQKGFKVVVTDRFEKCLDQFKKVNPHLVLLDITGLNEILS
jgi:PleD family two-component response regulator